jgi:hypothetical protein
MRPVIEAVRIASHTDEYNYHLARKESTLNECTGRAEDCMFIEAIDADMRHQKRTYSLDLRRSVVRAYEFFSQHKQLLRPFMTYPD